MDYSKIGMEKCYQIHDFKIKTIIMKYLFLCNIEKLKDHQMNPTILKEKNKYKVAYLDEGNNYILFLKELDNIYYTLLIKKNFNYNYNEINFNNLDIFFLDITYSEIYYKGTIIEGRLNNNLDFNIYNILKLKGKDINNNLSDTEFHIKNEISELSNKYFSLKLINYIDLKEMKNNNCNGLLFIDVNTKTKYIHIFKNNTIIKKYAILYMKKLNTDIFNLECMKDAKKFTIGIAHIPNIKTSHFFNKFEKEIIVKCWYNEYFSKWVPYEISNDKISSYDYIINSTKKI
tara:strand:+ start:13577 stop:14440 length:864 start_codon:yes stop_codon:yes gene_type:complete